MEPTCDHHLEGPLGKIEAARIESICKYVVDRGQIRGAMQAWHGREAPLDVVRRDPGPAFNFPALDAYRAEAMGLHVRHDPGRQPGDRLQSLGPRRVP